MDISSQGEEIFFGLILHSGNARSYGMEAITEAKNSNLQKAKENIQKGKEELLNAQKLHANMIKEEACGNKTTFSLLLMHGEDHFMMGQLTIDLATELIDVYQKIEGKADK